MNRPQIVVARGLTKVYDTGPAPVVALDGFDLEVQQGRLIIIRGRSGSGKTTLLNLLGGLDKPTSGLVEIDGADVTQMDESALATMRRSTIGFVFQAFGLIPILTALENVELPMRLLSVAPSDRRARALELLERVGLAERVSHRPHELSGGEQQRVAIARALANQPKLLLADEPTGQLDSRTGLVIIDLIADLVENHGISAVVATHDPSHLGFADQVAELQDGRRVASTAP